MTFKDRIDKKTSINNVAVVWELDYRHDKLWNNQSNLSFSIIF